MASAPSKTTTTKTINAKTGVTTSTSTRTSGGSTTVTKSTTIGGSKTVSTPTSSTSSASTLPGTVLGAEWIAGPNDGGWTLCAPVAVANVLLGATGIESSNAQIEALYRRAGGIGDTGVPLVSALTAARMHGLAGERLKGFRRAALDDADILLLEIPGEEGGFHPVAFAGMTAITWGGEIPLEDLDPEVRIVDAWSLTWHGQETC